MIRSLHVGATLGVAGLMLFTPGVSSQHGADGGPQLVRAEPKQLEAARVRVERPSAATLEQTLDVAASVAAPGALTWNANPRLPGVVREVRVKAGDEVAQGAVLCVVESFALGEAVHDYLRLEALVRAHEQALPRRREMLERGVAFAAEALERGKTLGERGLNTWRELNELESALRDREFARDNALFEFETRLEDQRIELEAAAEHLRLLGVDTASLKQHAPGAAVHEHDAHAGRYEVRASVAGVVIELGARVGEYVDEHAVLARLRDLSTAWIEAQVGERDLANVRSGAASQVELAAFPGVLVQARVAFVSFELDPHTRSAAVRLEAANTPLSAWSERFPIRPGMSGRARIETGREQAALSVPLSALWRRGELDQVFVRTADGAFELRTVQLGARSRERVAVLGGVGAADEVAVDGLFFLKSMLARGDE